jgi:cyclase
MGDDFVTCRFPFIDVESGGSINGVIDAVQQVVSQLPADVKVILGHGPVSNPTMCEPILECWRKRAMQCRRL